MCENEKSDVGRYSSLLCLQKLAFSASQPGPCQENDNKLLQIQKDLDLVAYRSLIPPQVLAEKKIGGAPLAPDLVFQYLIQEGEPP